MLHSLFPKAHQKLLSLPLLGPITDGFDDWLAASGFTRGSQKFSIRMLPHVDRNLRRRIDEVAKLNHAVLDDCCKALMKRYPCGAGTAKRARQRAIDYLEYEEIDAILKAIDRATPQGSRDYALLAMMFNTGGRVQEIADLRACDLQLTKPFQVRLFGKGRKEHYCPPWPQTATVLRHFASSGIWICVRNLASF